MPRLGEYATRHAPKVSPTAVALQPKHRRFLHAGAKALDSNLSGIVRRCIDEAMAAVELDGWDVLRRPEDQP